MPDIKSGKSFQNLLDGAKCSTYADLRGNAHNIDHTNYSNRSNILFTKKIINVYVLLSLHRNFIFNLKNHKPSLKTVR